MFDHLWPHPLWHTIMSKIDVTLENPYSEVSIPRAKLRSSNDIATVIANPMALSSDGGNPYGVSSSAPPPYVVKEAGGGEEEEEGRSRACCYRCRRRKWCYRGRRTVIGSDILISWSLWVSVSFLWLRKQQRKQGSNQVKRWNKNTQRKKNSNQGRKEGRKEGGRGKERVVDVEEVVSWIPLLLLACPASSASSASDWLILVFWPTPNHQRQRRLAGCFLGGGHFVSRMSSKWKTTKCVNFLFDL